MILLIIILVLVFGVGGGYYGHSRWGGEPRDVKVSSFLLPQRFSRS
jgi:hypothetical protein